MLPLFIRLASMARLATLLAMMTLPSFHSYRTYGVLQRGMSAFRWMDPVIHRDTGSSLQCTQSDDVVAINDGNDGITKKYEYQIKKARKKHIKDISKLCVETFLGDGDDWLHINREKQNVARDLTKRLGAANTTFLVVEAVQPGSTDNATNEVVGFVEVTSTREHCFVLAADVPYREYRSKITSLVVETAHRRQGVASLLLAACAKQCQIWSGHTELFLEIRSENHGARQFYEKMGFHQCVGAKDLIGDSSANIDIYILLNQLSTSSG